MRHLNQPMTMTMPRAPEGAEGGSGTTPQAGTPAGSQAPAGHDGGGKGGDPWYTSLGPEYADNPNFTRYASLPDFAKGHMELATKLGSTDPAAALGVYVSQNAGKPGALDNVFNTLGRPPTAAEYGLKAADGAPEWLAKWTEGVASVLHPLGASKAQVEALGKFTNEQFAGVMQAEAEAKQQRFDATELGLRQKYGKDFDTNAELVKGLVQTLGGDKAQELQDRLNLHFADMPFMFDVLLEAAKGRQESTGIQPGGGAATSAVSFNSAAAAQGALAELDADPDNNRLMQSAPKSDPQRQQLLAKRKAIIAEINRLNGAQA